MYQKILLSTLCTTSLIIPMDQPLPDPSATADQKKRYETRNDDFRFNPGDEKRPEAEFGVGAEVHINNFRNPVIINDRLRTRGADPKDEENDAVREGQLRFMQQKEQQRLASEYATSDEAKRQKQNLLQAQIDLEKEAREYEIRKALSPEGKRNTENEVNAAAYKHKLMQDAITRQKLDRETVALMQTATQTQAVTQASAEVAAKLWLRNNDPDQSVRGRITLLVKEAAIRFALETFISAARQGSSFVGAKLYQTYLKLPLAHCVELRKQEEMLRSFKTFQAQEEMLRKEKDDIQESLNRDAEILKKEEKNINFFKKKLIETNDHKAKEQLKEVIEALENQHIENRLKYARLLKLNANQQPYFTRLRLAEAARQKQTAASSH